MNDDKILPRKKIDARPERCILALGAWCWGKGRDSTAAKRKARAEGKPLDRGFKLLDAPLDAYVDELGYVVWKGGDDVRPVVLGWMK